MIKMKEAQNQKLNMELDGTSSLSDPKQFMHKFDFSVDTFLSCGTDLNLAHAYKGCFSVLQAMHWLGVDSVLANKVTSLLDEKGLLVDDDSCFVCFFPDSAMEVSKACARRE